MKTFLRGLAAPIVALLALSFVLPAYAQVTVPTYIEAATGNTKQGIGVTQLGMDAVPVATANVPVLSGATLTGGVLSFTANSQFAVVDTQGYSTVTIQPSGTFTASYQFSWSETSTGAWTVGAMTDPSNAGANADGTGPFSSNTNLLNGNVQARYLKILITGYTSGTVQLQPVLHGGGRLPVRSNAVTVLNSVAMQGIYASGTTATPNPLTIGIQDGSVVRSIPTALNANQSSGTGVPAEGPLGKYNSTLPTYTDGQYGNLQIGPKGALDVSLWDPTSGVGATVTAAGDGQSNGTAGLVVSQARMSLFNSSTWDRWISMNALGGAGASTGIAAVGNTPTSSQGQAIAPVATAAVASNQVARAAGANLYRWTVTSGASAGYVMIFDATSAPADGAVTPKQCYVLAANSTLRDNIGDFAERYSVGITIVFSTTGCYSKTASATAFISSQSF